MKLIKQWFVGLVFAIFGGSLCILPVGLVIFFIAMVTTTGAEFIKSFFLFLLGLCGFLVLPYLFFQAIKDSVKESFK